MVDVAIEGDFGILVDRLGKSGSIVLTKISGAAEDKNVNVANF